MFQMGIILLVIGLIARKATFTMEDYEQELKYPRFIKTVSIFKSKRAMKSYENFLYAQRRTQKTIIFVGVIYIILGSLFKMVKINFGDLYWVLSLLLIIFTLAGIIGYTEYKLYKNFE